MPEQRPIYYATLPDVGTLGHWRALMQAIVDLKDNGVPADVVTAFVSAFVSAAFAVEDILD
jgi:hypothetical protein